MKSKHVLTLLLACTGWAAGCSLVEDLDGYAGGDAGGAVDTGTGADTGKPDVGGDTTVADSGADGTTDTGADSTAADSTVDTGAGDTGTGDTGGGDTGTGDTGAGDTGTGDTGGTGDGATDAPIGCHPLINEVQSRGTGVDGGVAAASDEFIEIYNPCSTDITVTGWKLAYRSASGSTESTLVTLTGTIPSDGFLLYSSPGGSFASIANGTWSSSGIADDGSAGLKDSAGVVVDSVGWGSATTANPFVRKAAAPQPVAAQSIGRVPNGVDTSDNAADFKKITTPSPKAKN